MYKTGVRPAYVDVCKYKSDRSTLCKFRISAHRLAIERGRYSNTERQNRICQYCNTGEIEDEQHFFLICPFYSPMREKIIQKLNDNLSNLVLRSLSLRLITELLNSNKPIFLKFTVGFLDECLSLRNNN